MKRSYLKQFAAAGLATATILTMSIAPSFAMTEQFNDASINDKSGEWAQFCKNWDAYSSNYENAVMTPGANETEMNFAWYSKTKETPKVRIVKNKKADLETKATEFSGTQITIESQKDLLGTDTYTQQKLEGYNSNKVTVTGLEPNTHYYYQIFQDGAWQEAQSFNTRSNKSFSFLYVGDPQIGASTGRTTNDGSKITNNIDGSKNLVARNDSFNWIQTLKNATSAHPDVSFMMSAGDQINYNNKKSGSSLEAEYAGYLGPEQLRSLPVATTIGNHDSLSNQYTLHFNNPNSQERTKDSTKAGTDYFFSHNNALFIILDTNDYNVADHEATIKKAIDSDKDAKWRIVMFHQDIYGSGYDHSDSDGIVLRTQLTPLFDKYDIDVALQGHDHTYSRTYQLTSDGKEHKAYTGADYAALGVKAGDSSDAKDAYLAENNDYTIQSDAQSGTVTNPKGTVYMEANSATGSKFYNLIPQKQDYISERSQTWTPSYSVVKVSGDELTIKTYDAQTNAELGGSSAYTIQKTSNAEKKVVKKQVIKVKAAKKSMKVTVTKSAAATKYEIKYGTDKKITKNVKTVTLKAGQTSKTIKGLKKGKTYYVKARTIAGSTKGAYSTVKKVTIK